MNNTINEIILYCFITISVTTAFTVLSLELVDKHVDLKLRHYFFFKITKENILEYLATFKYINQGGCLIASYSIYLWYKKNYPNIANKIQIVQLSTNNDAIKHNKKFLNNKKDNAVSDIHFGITFDNRKFLDSEKIINKKSYKYFIINNRDIDKFCISALNKDLDWNPDFNRKYIKKIENKLGINLNIN